MTEQRPVRKRSVIGVRLFAHITVFLFYTQLAAQNAVNPDEHVIHVKFKEHYATTVNNGNRIAGFGFQGLDKLNTTNRVTSSTRVFPHAGKYEDAHRAYGLHLWYEIHLPKDKPLNTLLQEYRSLGYFEKVETFVPYSTAAPTPVSLPGGSTNDPLFGTQWHFRNSGSSDVDIKLPLAWQIETGQSNVIVAVIDGGIDINHEDLKDAIWQNQNEIPGNNLDDDGNGYVDDVTGFNFADKVAAIRPELHGTHVAGTIGAITNNGVGVAGIAGGSGGSNGVRLMPCEIFGATRNGGAEDAMVYAADNGAVISQNSWGGGSTAIESAINYFIDRAGLDNTSPNFKLSIQIGPVAGGIVIFAAGNDNTTNMAAAYPAGLAQVVAVAATDGNDNRANFSNYGNWVDISAPGTSVYSTFPSNSYGNLSGTSMACPHVSGVAALIISKYGGSSLKVSDVRTRLLSATDNIYAKYPALTGNMGSGRLNAAKALQNADNIPPATINDLRVSKLNWANLTMQWTAPSSGGATEPVASYQLARSPSPITNENFDVANVVTLATVPGDPGTTQEYEIGIFDASQFYLAIRSLDAYNNRSLVSNVLSVNPPSRANLTLPAIDLDRTLHTGEKTTGSITLTNAGDAGDGNLSIRITCPETWIILDPGPIILRARETKILPVTFDAHALASTSGARLARIEIVSNDDSFNNLQGFFKQARLTVIDAPEIQIKSLALDFGKQYVAMPKDTIISIINAGALPLNITSIVSSDPHFSTTITNTTVQAGQIEKMIVTFSPDNPVLQNGTITLSSNDPFKGVMTIPVAGRGELQASVPVSLPPVSFTLNAGESATQPFTSLNSGSGDFDWSASVFAPTFPGTTRPTPTAILDVRENLSPGTMIDGEFVPTAPSAITISSPVVDPRTGYVYVRGFQSSSGGGSNYFRYDPFRDTWLELALAPLINEKKVDVFLDGKIYEAVGTQLGVYDIASNTWSLVSLAHNLATNDITTDGTRIFGVSTNANQFWQYTPASNAWTQLADPPVPFNDEGGLAYHNGVIYGHVGGDNASQSKTAFLKYNIAGNFWERLTSYPGRPYAGATIDPSRRLLYVLGVEKILGIYDIDKGTWAQKQMPWASIYGLAYNGYEGAAGIYISGGGLVRIQTSPSPPWLTVTPQKGTVAPFSNLSGSLKVDTKGLIGGTYAGEVKIQSKISPSVSTSLPVTLTIVGTPDIEVAQTSLQIDSYVSESSEAQFIIKNAGTDILEISSIVSDNPTVSSSYTNLNLYPGQTLKLPISFQPSAVSVEHPTITLTTNDPDESSVVLNLTANGQMPPLIQLAPASIPLVSLLAGDRFLQTVNISNTGGSDLEFEAKGLQSWLDASPASGIIHPGESQNITVTVNAAMSTGSYSGVVEVTHKGTRAVQLPVSMTITGNAPGISLPSMLDYGSLFVNLQVNGCRRAVRIKNTGTQILTINDIRSSDGHFGVHVYPRNVAVGSSDEFDVDVDCSVTGDFDGVISVASNDPTDPIVSFAAHATVIERPHLAVNPLTVIAVVSTGETVTKSVTLKNTKAIPLTWSAAMDGNGSAQLDKTSGTIPGFGETNISMTFTAEHLRTYSYDLGLTILSNADNGNIRVPITLNATYIGPMLAVGYIGKVIVSKVQQRKATLRIWNSGTGDLDWNFMFALPSWLTAEKTSGHIHGNVYEDVGIILDGAKAEISQQYSLFIHSSDPFVPSYELGIRLEVTDNHFPSLKKVVPTQTIKLASDARTVDLSKIFVDPDDDAITLSATVLDGRVASVVMSENSIVMSPIAKGLTFVNVTATDSHGAATNTQFTIVVPPEGTTAQQTITGILESPSGYFISASPVPFNNNVMFTCEIPVAGTVTIVLHDMTGKMIWQRSDFIPAPGRSEAVFNSETLAPGVYVSRFLKDGKSIGSIRLIKQ